MTEYMDVVEERDGYRVRLEYDTDPLEPSDSDAMVPVLRIDNHPWAGSTAEAFNNQASGFEDAYNHFAEFARGRAVEVFTRYVHIFHGATKVDTWNLGITREYGYIGFDTSEWRETVGAAPERLAKEDLLEEVRDWATGEVYGYVIEKELHYTKSYAEDPYATEDGTQWVEVEDGTCWGFYGRKWAEEAATAELTNIIG